MSPQGSQIKGTKVHQLRHTDSFHSTVYYDNQFIQKGKQIKVSRQLASVIMATELVMISY